MSQAQKRFSRKGLENSTTLGAYQAGISNQATLRELANQASALDFLNTRALDNGSYNRSVLGDLTSLAQIPTALSNSNLLEGLNDSSQTNRFNTGQTNQYNQHRLQSGSQIFQAAINTLGKAFNQFPSG